MLKAVSQIGESGETSDLAARSRSPNDPLTGQCSEDKISCTLGEEACRRM